jgi:hypothetical protein
METNETSILELGMVLGQRKTGMIAGRCSAAHAECLRKLRDEKLYLRFASNWEEYCNDHLKINRRSADRVIAMLKQYGPLYFELAEMTGITAASYRKIAGAIQQDGIHVDGEVIALIPENTHRAIDAVARLQSEAEDAPPSASATEAAQKSCKDLEKRAKQVADGLRRAALEADPFDRQWFVDAARNMRRLFEHLELEM